MNKIKAILMTGVLTVFSGCNTLDVPPQNILSDVDIFSGRDGITAYLVQIYRELPVWQFHSGDLAGGATSMTFSGEIVTGNFGNEVRGSSFAQLGTPTWIPIVWKYECIRRINYFLQNLPAYAGSYPEPDVNGWLAEAYFSRAFRYFEMAKRWGGVPIVTQPTNYPEQSAQELKVPRNKEADVYDFVLADLDEAIRLFPNDPGSRVNGRANKWSSLALKARVALHAGSLAVYGPKYLGGHMYMEGLTGVPTERAAEYFDIAYRAASEVVASGHYELYKNQWAANNPAAQEENYVQAFLNEENKEHLYTAYYRSQNNATMFDANNRPFQVGVGYGGKASPTVEMVERFEYAATGEPFRLDVSKTGTDANPRLYKNTIDIFEGVEPRLRASIILPGCIWMDEEIDIRYGIVPKGSKNIADILTSAAVIDPYTADGISMNKQGKSGIGNDACTYTGFYVRKFLDPTLDRTLIMNHIHGSTVPWPEIRYAEVLLTLAEAAVELNELGDAGATEKMTEAAKHINAIRERAGAFNRNFTASTLTIKDVRDERRKELFFENKTYWDLVRWRVAHEEISNKQWNLLRPVYFWDGDANDRHYYMKRDSAGDNFRKTFNPRYYYQDIPNADRNELLIGNPNATY